jgi:alpha-galactosidase
MLGRLVVGDTSIRPGTLLLLLHMMSQMIVSTPRDSADAVASPAPNGILLNAAQPAADWEMAAAVTFCSDWQGKNPDPNRETRVRVMWSLDTLYLRFECRYRVLHLFEDSDPNGRRDQLWDRDVAEAFLQPDPSQPRAYKEFEISPNGLWIDLDISPGGKADLKSGMQRSVVLDERAHTWAAELAIPMKALTTKFDPGSVWRVNFFRVEGQQEPRGYYAWQPTHTPQPNFHVPSALGRLRFAAIRDSESQGG